MIRYFAVAVAIVVFAGGCVRIPRQFVPKEVRKLRSDQIVRLELLAAGGQQLVIDGHPIPKVDKLFGEGYIFVAPGKHTVQFKAREANAAYKKLLQSMIDDGYTSIATDREAQRLGIITPPDFRMQYRFDGYRAFTDGVNIRMIEMTAVDGRYLYHDLVEKTFEFVAEPGKSYQLKVESTVDEVPGPVRVLSNEPGRAFAKLVAPDR